MADLLCGIGPIARVAVPEWRRRIVQAMSDDPLLGCRLKLQAAWRHRQALGEQLEAFVARDDPEPSPLHLGVIVGDFLHNLRCVLDHLVWQLVELNGVKPGDHNQFPIFDTPAAYNEKAGRYLRGVASDHRALIEGFQPYHLDGDPTRHYLAVLRDLSNIDKHRFVHPVVTVGDGDGREVRFTELEVTTNALFRLEHYMTYAVFRRFETLFPLPPHAVDNAIANAIEDAVAGGIGASGTRPEVALVGALADALSRRQDASVLREVRYRDLPGWTRPPGGVDLALDGLVPGRVLIEMKVNKPDEALWDALKLADILATQRDLAAAYLVYAGTERTWREEVEGADLFLRGGMWRARDLAGRWPRAWAGVLQGGRGVRPCRGVGAITLTPVGWVGVAGEPGHSVRAVRVAPVLDVAPQQYDDDGWPVEFDPPGDLRAHVRRAEARRRAGKRVGAVPETDPCHGYPWYQRWTDRRLAEVVGAMDDNDAFQCLRRRLAAERGWQDADLRARVDRLRGSST